MLQQKLPAKNGLLQARQYTSAIDQYFGGRFVCELKCAESEEEPVAASEESFLQLSCFISQDVKYLHSGLQLVIISIHRSPVTTTHFCKLFLSTEVA